MGHANSFLILLLGFVIFLVAYLQSSKKKIFPSGLNMKKDAPLEDLATSQSKTATKLNVMFNFNGHSFDAYQALGVPAGSDWEDVKKAFESSIRLSDQDSQEFYKTALAAIKSSLKS